MERKLEAKYGMIHCITTLGNNSLEILKTIPALYTLFVAMLVKTGAISNALQTLSRKISGITTDKEELREQLVLQTDRLAGVIRSYAVTIKDTVLKKALKFTLTELRDKADDQLAETSLTVLSAAKTHLANLADYTISPAVVDAFEKQVLTYKEKVQLPRIAINNRKMVNELIKNLFAETEQMLTDQIDPLVKLLEETYPDFVRNYQANRKVINPRTIATRIAGFITDKNTGQPVRNVMVSIVGQPFVTNSDKKGNYRLLVPLAGTYTIVFEKEGYEPLQMSGADVTIGQITTLNIIMTAIK